MSEKTKEGADPLLELAAYQLLSASSQALRRTPGNEAIHALGWWDLLGELPDPTARAAVFALFRAQGRELASSGALAGLMAHPYLATPRCHRCRSRP